MSSSESKASYPATPLKNSDTSSVPTDLTVSSGENAKVGMISSVTTQEPGCDRRPYVSP